MGIKSFEGLFVGGFEGANVDAVGSLGALLGGGGDAVALGGYPKGEDAAGPWR